MDSLLNTAFQRQKPVFQKSPDEVLFQRMKKRVLARVQELEPRRRPLILLKALLFPLAYVGAYACALAFGRHTAALYGAYLAMGLLLVVVFQNQVHDAVHGSLWKKKWLNEAYVHLFDLMGANSFIWKARHVRIPAVEYVKLFVFKTIFPGYTVVVPKVLLGLGWITSIGAFLVMLFSASVFSLLILLSPHANVENSFPLPDGAGHLPYPWFEHQLRHTNDVTEDNWFTRFCLGCFNYHVAHHLFPGINHVFAPEVTAILREEAGAHGLRYRAFPLGKTLRDHYRLLKRNGVEEDFFEEVM